MKHFLSKTLFRINIIIAALTALAYLSILISPVNFWPIAFLGLLYPFLLVINIIFIFIWAFRLRWKFLISFVIVVSGYPFFIRYAQYDIPFTKKKEPTDLSNTFKILSYNVRLFNQYQWLKDSRTGHEIFNFIEKETPDIICFQEFYTRQTGSLAENEIIRHLKSTPYYHIKYTYRKPGTSNFGIATFSKYPIINRGEIIFDKTYNACIYSDIKIGDDTIRLFNNHLQSVKFLKRNYDLLDSLKLTYNQKQMNGILDITNRLKWAFKLRAMQADEVAAFIRHSPYPVIVCGDFNDSPVSYTYQTISKNLKDAFIEAGSGLGNTYLGKFPSYRIDYILLDQSYTATNYRTPKLALSDHYPVLCRIYKK